MTHRVELLQDVVVFGTTVERSVILVDLYGSLSNICGTVRFVITDPERRRKALELLALWCRDATALTLVVRGTSVSLQNDEAVFRARLPEAELR